MTNPEFSNSFDLLLNSYASQAQFGEGFSKQEAVLNEYEKSVFLTQAQEDVVVELYTGKNSTGESFEQTEELRRNLSSLVVDATLTPITTSSGSPLGTKSKFFSLPDGSDNLPKVWFIVYEALNTAETACEAYSTIEVVPVTHDEYHRIKNNPFRGANRHRALRLDLLDGQVEIVSTYTVTSYYIRYLKKPSPIVLVNLTGEGLSIDGETNYTECQLHESLHQKILDRAVQLALQSKRINNTNNR